MNKKLKLFLRLFYNFMFVWCCLNIFKLAYYTIGGSLTEHLGEPPIYYFISFAFGSVILCVELFKYVCINVSKNFDKYREEDIEEESK